MEERNIGHSGLRVSTIGLGCNNFGSRMEADATSKVIDAAIEHGITFFDTAASYGNNGGSETLIGKFLGPRRKNIVLATKFGWSAGLAGTYGGGSRRALTASTEASLTRLQTDWIDLLYLHKPDHATPIEETLRALDDLIHQGKVRYVACSNLASWQVVEAHFTARAANLNPFICTQDEYSLLVRDVERELTPALRHVGMGLIPYFPLASGILTGKYRRNHTMPTGTRLASTPSMSQRFLTDANMAIAEKLSDWCEQHGHTLTELAFSWLLAQPTVASVIAGATSPAQIAQNAAAGGWKLTDAELKEIADLLKPAE
jgi:aryl-alcohol dehydrogenase-like predicted oxidoreductase